MNTIVTNEFLSNPTHAKLLISTLANVWTIDILLVLKQNETMRFGAIRSEIGGISGRVLSVRLKRLEELGFISRYSHSTTPPRVDYTLTDSGNELIELIGDIETRAARWIKK